MAIECLVGVDIGGTSIKAIICDADARELAFYKSSTLPAYQKSNGTAVDTGPQRNFIAESLWSITAATIRGAVERLPAGCVVRSIAVSSCGCTMLLLDEDGRQIPLQMESDLLRKECAFYRETVGEARFTATTGYPLDESLSGMHLSALCQTGIAKQIAHILAVDDYIVYRLSNQFSRNYSTAASNGMWDRQRRCWLPDFTARTSLSQQVLGGLTESGCCIGRISDSAAGETGLPHSTQVCTGGMDYECAALACRSLLQGGSMNITGTIDLLATFQDSTNVLTQGACRHVSDYHVVPGESSHMLETIGAAQTEWLKNNIVASAGHGFSLNWEDYFSAMEQRYSQEAITTELFLPTVFGTYVPHINMTATGVFSGLNPETDTVSLLQAVLEGMSFQTKRMLQWLCPENTCKQLVLVGGGSKNRIWSQIKADVLGMNVLAPAIPEASAIGAALLGGVGSGLYQNHEQAGTVLKDCAVQRINYNVRRNEYYNQVFTQAYLPLEQHSLQMDEAMRKIKESFGGAV